jgi:hypothetical protein
VSLSLNAFATQEASSWALCESFFDASVAPTDCISPPFKLAAVASFAPSKAWERGMRCKLQL